MTGDMGLRTTQHGFESLHIKPLNRDYPEMLVVEPALITRFIRALPGFGLVPRGILAGGWMPGFVLTFTRGDGTSVAISVHYELKYWTGEHGDRFMDPVRFEQVLREARDWWSDYLMKNPPEPEPDDSAPRLRKRSRRDHQPPEER